MWGMKSACAASAISTFAALSKFLGGMLLAASLVSSLEASSAESLRCVSSTIKLIGLYFWR